MATVVTVDGIFESISTNLELTPASIKVPCQGIFSNSVAHATPDVTSTIKPDWRHPERKIG
jgi:hypothetical protein